MPGRCKIFTRSEQVPQMRLAKCCFHWLLNCRSLRRFRCSVGIDAFLSVPLGSSLAKTLCFCGKPFLNCFPWSRHAMRLKLFWLPKRRVTSFCSPGDGSTGSARFWKMCDVRPQEAATVAVDGGARCRRKKVISRCIICGPGFARKPFTHCYSTRAIHNACVTWVGAALNSRCAHLCGWVKKT